MAKKFHRWPEISMRRSRPSELRLRFPAFTLLFLIAGKLLLMTLNVAKKAAIG